MAFRLNRRVTYFRTLKTISVQRFDDALKGDLSRLIRGRWNRNRLPGDVEDVWTTLYKEYIERTNQNSSLRIYVIKSELQKLRDRYAICGEILNRLEDGRPREVAEAFAQELKGWNLYLDLNKPHQPQIKALKKQLQNSVNRMKRLTAEIEDIQDENKSDAKLTLNQLKMKAMLSQKIHIDLNTMTMDEWIIMWEEIENTAKQVQRKMKKHVK